MVPKPNAEPINNKELIDSMTDAEQFWHRANKLLELPVDKFVGVNNIKGFLLNILSYDELVYRTFDNFELRGDGTWRTSDK